MTVQREQVVFAQAFSTCVLVIQSKDRDTIANRAAFRTIFAQPSTTTTTIMSTVTAAVAALLALSCACCIGYSMGAPLLRQTFVETHDSLLMPRFHIRTDGREGWLITNMTCSSAKTLLQLGACDSRGNQAFPGTCFQIMSKVPSGVCLLLCACYETLE